jgi:hypothetical protein
MSFDVSAPKTRWWGALYDWADSGGDLRSVVELLRVGVPIHEEHAAVLADILDGSVVPKASRGGPGRHTQLNHTWVETKARFMFAIELQRLRDEAGSLRPKGRRLREEAAELAAARLGLSTDDVVRIVGRGMKPAPSFEELVVRKP